MFNKFSKRYGYGISKVLIYDDAPTKLRIGLWNLIEDYAEQERFGTYGSLYNQITSNFRIQRKSLRYDEYRNEIRNFVITSFKWYEIMDLIEYLFEIVKSTEFNPYENEFAVVEEKTKDARYNFTKDINNILNSENVGWRLIKGRVERIGNELLNIEVVGKARRILENAKFAGPNSQFIKAIDFFNKRPEPDIENCIKESVGSIEGMVRIILQNEKIVLGDGICQLVRDGKIRKPLDKVFHAIYGFASAQPGLRHGAHVLPNIDFSEAEFSLYCAGICIVFLSKIVTNQEIQNDDFPPDEDPF